MNIINSSKCLEGICTELFGNDDQPYSSMTSYAKIESILLNYYESMINYNNCYKFEEFFNRESFDTISPTQNRPHKDKIYLHKQSSLVVPSFRTSRRTGSCLIQTSGGVVFSPDNSIKDHMFNLKNNTKTGKYIYEDYPTELIHIENRKIINESPEDHKYFLINTHFDQRSRVFDVDRIPVHFINSEFLAHPDDINYIVDRVNNIYHEKLYVYGYGFDDFDEFYTKDEFYKLNVVSKILLNNLSDNTMTQHKQLGFMVYNNTLIYLLFEITPRLTWQSRHSKNAFNVNLVSIVLGYTNLSTREAFYFFGDLSWDCGFRNMKL